MGLTCLCFFHQVYVYGKFGICITYMDSDPPKYKFCGFEIGLDVLSSVALAELP